MSVIALGPIIKIFYIFRNGFLDPWSGGGWSLTPKVEGTLVSVILKEGAHHYDLRGAHPADTEEVKKIREQEKTYIRNGSKKQNGEKIKTDESSFSISSCNKYFLSDEYNDIKTFEGVFSVHYLKEPTDFLS
ncbi:hypothetical protein COOONC_13510 [Cooperia oncophora]